MKRMADLNCAVNSESDGQGLAHAYEEDDDFPETCDIYLKEVGFGEFRYAMEELIDFQKQEISDYEKLLIGEQDEARRIDYENMIKSGERFVEINRDAIERLEKRVDDHIFCLSQTGVPVWFDVGRHYKMAHENEMNQMMVQTYA